MVSFCVFVMSWSGVGAGLMRGIVVVLAVGRGPISGSGKFLQAEGTSQVSQDVLFENVNPTP